MRIRTESPEKTIVLKDVQHPTHLTEDENARAFLMHGLKQLVQDDHFPTVIDQMLVSCVRRARFLDKSIQMDAEP